MSLTETTPSLEQLATTINTEHNLVINSITTFIEHAIRAGEALTAARTLVPPGEWGRWLDQHFPATRTTAARYIRISKHREHVLNAAGIEDAMRTLTNLGIPADRPGLPRSPHLETIREMRSNGAPLQEIAAATGLSEARVSVLAKPDDYLRDLKKRRHQSAQERARERKAAQAALERQQRDSAMRKTGGDAWDAYLLTRKLAPLLDQLKLSSAYAKCVAIEDELHQHAKEI